MVDSWKVLHIHSWWPEGGSDDDLPNRGNCVAEGPLIAVGYGESCRYEISHSSDILAGRVNREMSYVDSNDGDEFEVIPEEEWTDEICVLMAKRALLWEANNG